MKIILLSAILLLVTVVFITIYEIWHRHRERQLWLKTRVALIKNRKVIVALDNYIGPVIITKVMGDIFNAFIVRENEMTGGSYKIEFNALHERQIIG